VVVEAAKGISEGKFDPKPDEKGYCQWCDYMQICPAFAGRKILPVQRAVPDALSEMADRFGKLDAKIRELAQERNQLADDIQTHFRISGKTEAEGKYFTVKAEPGSDNPSQSLSATPKEDAGNA
jgi:hypothetical protein